MAPRHNLPDWQHEQYRNPAPLQGLPALLPHRQICDKAGQGHGSSRPTTLPRGR